MRSLFVILALMLPISAHAGLDSVPADKHDLTQGKVISVEPQYRTVVRTVETPVNECHIEERQHLKKDADGSTAGTIIGGITGGVIGNQIGEGSGKDAATFLGAVTGMVVGNELSKEQKIVTESKKVCNKRIIKDYKKEIIIDGFNIVLRLKGSTSTIPVYWKKSTGVPKVGDIMRVQVSYTVLSY